MKIKFDKKNIKNKISMNKIKKNKLNFDKIK
jgi:hypothetical protein